MADRSADGVKIRSQTQWLEQGEKPSRFFFKLERERIERNFVKSIFDPNGKEVFTHEEIENAHLHFYTNPFSAEQIVPECQESLLGDINSSLSDSD